MLGMGGNCSGVSSQRCCDVCTPDAITANDRLNVLDLGKVVRRKRRAAARLVNDELLDKLKKELYVERTKYKKIPALTWLELNLCVQALQLTNFALKQRT